MDVRSIERGREAFVFSNRVSTKSPLYTIAGDGIVLVR